MQTTVSRPRAACHRAYCSNGQSPVIDTCRNRPRSMPWRCRDDASIPRDMSSTVVVHSPGAGLTIRSWHTLLTGHTLETQLASRNDDARASNITPFPARHGALRLRLRHSTRRKSQAPVRSPKMLQDTPPKPGKLPRISIRKRRPERREDGTTSPAARSSKLYNGAVVVAVGDRQTVMPSLVRNHENGSIGTSPVPSEDTRMFDEALEILSNLPDPPAATPDKSSWHGAKFAVDEIVGQGKRHDTTVYKVAWKNSKVPTRLLRAEDGRDTVRCDKQEYIVRSYCPVSPELGANNEPHLLIDWKSTWEDEGFVLECANPQLEDFLRKMRESQEIDEASSNERQTRTQQQSTSASPTKLRPQGIVYSPSFRPERSQVYNDALRRLLRGVAGDVGKLLSMPDSNDLIFRKRYLQRTFNAECPKMRRAAALQMVGMMQKKKCDHCTRGLGPFRGCVVLTGFARGACANCLYSSRMPMECNYHCQSRAKDGPWTPVSASEHAQRRRDAVAASDGSWPRVVASPAVDSPARRLAAETQDTRGQSLTQLEARDPETVTCVFDARSSPPLLALEPQRSDAAPAKQSKVTNMPALVEPRYLSPLFRHAQCLRSRLRCADAVASYSNKQRKGGHVARGQIFHAGEASVEQVRWLTAMSGCSMTEYMHRAWLWRLQKRDLEPLPLGWRKETFISYYHWAELNWMADQIGAANKQKKKAGKKAKRGRGRGGKWGRRGSQA
ncbi:hypothetical protein CLAFUW4_10527 [Fulvia fulva]|nr:hypothetical protein CLAFUR4_10532 [Fulvia fulva]WPV19180.1 hypothetical protein CLAFUW4_10527 [Fulvia fulva]WPV33921.1 hypothetical protein CLAFUW7_10529 [Fulvia fulva]